MIRRNWLSFLCALAMVLASVSAHGQEPELLKYTLECDEKNWALCAQPLLQGERAPFDGQLLSPELAIELGQKALDFDIEMSIRLDRQRQLHDIEMAYQKEIHDLDNAAAEKQIDLLAKELEEASAVPWYRTPVFVAVVSCVTTGLVFVGAAYLVKSVD